MEARVTLDASLLFAGAADDGSGAAMAMSTAPMNLEK